MRKTASKKHRVICLKACGKAIGKKLKAALDDLQKLLRPEVVLLNKQLFRLFGPKIQNIHDVDKMISDQYFLKDISKYICAGYVSRDNRFSQYSWTRNVDLKFSEWLKGLAPDNKIYPALAKTVYGISYPVPFHLIRKLSEIILPRVFLNRTELLAYLTASTRGNFNLHEHIFAKTTIEEIRKAHKIYNRHLLRDLEYRSCGLRKFMNIDCLVTYVCDFPERLGRGVSIVTLTKRAIDWHRTFNRAGRWSLPAVTGPLALPQVHFPQIDGIRLLTHSDDLVKESEDMDHCVQSYARSAMEGRCYILHADYDGEAATVEISPTGRIVQVKGPQNKQNKACDYVLRNKELKDWLDKFTYKEEYGNSIFDVDPLNPF